MCVPDAAARADSALSLTPSPCAQPSPPRPRRLCRIYKDTGHGTGKTSGQTVAENTEKLLFLALAMGLEWAGGPTPA